MKIMSIAVFSKAKQSIQSLYRELPKDQDMANYKMAIATGYDYKNGLYSFAPCNDQRIIFMEVTNFNIYMFISSEVVSFLGATSIMTHIKYYLANEIAFAERIPALENYVMRNFPVSNATKVKMTQQMLDETKDQFMTLIDKLIDRQEKIEVLQTKLIPLNKEISFKTKVFQQKKSGAFFNFFYTPEDNTKKNHTHINIPTIKLAH